MAKKKKLTKREQDRIDNLCRARYWERETAKQYVRAIHAREKRYKSLVTAAISVGRAIVADEKKLEQTAKRIMKIEEKLKCLTAIK